ncbi:MAG: hypothetical protein ABJA20_06800 [Novosphingobium sp.]
MIRSNNITGAAFMIGALALPAAAYAAPGMGSEVYSATVEPHELEIETRYGILAGGPDGGEDGLVLEAGYGVTGHTRVAAVAEFEKEVGAPRKLEAFSIEVIQNVARIGPIDVGVYGEYEAVVSGTDKLEGKLLLEYRGRVTDLRFNLIAAKPLRSGDPVELGYAASADVAVADNLRLGVAAFGELGTFRDFAPRAEHFVGPNVKFRILGLGVPLKVETGYLIALAKAKDDADGMFRLNLELEF